MTLNVRLLGPAGVSRDDTVVEFRGHKPVALLTYLLLTGNPQRRQHLTDLLYDGSADPRASLRWTLHHLRRAIGPEYVEADRQRIAFDFAQDYWLDVDAFAAGELGLYRGDLLEGMHLADAQGFMEWLFFERERLKDVYQGALARQLEACESGGAHGQAATIAQRLIRLDDLREEWHRALMRAYAGQGKREAALAQYAACRDLLRAELGVPPAGETQALAEAIRQGAASPAPVRPVSLAPPSPLPAPRTAFIGRETELETVVARLREPTCRLFTLIGPGGVGKTRLAVEAVRRLDGEFSHGVCFVDLTPVSAPEYLVAAIANALAFTFYSQEDPLDQLGHYLARKRMLLVLDNFEHLPAAAEQVAALLRAAPAVTVLVTSRQRLGLPQEWLLDVRGLAVPPAGEGEGARPVDQYDAVQLFLQRAQRIHAGYAPAGVPPPEQAHVARICRLVEGLPLAIEMAAAWVRALPVGEIAASVAAALDMQAGAGLSVPERHRSLRAVFATSWALLAAEERRVLARLSVFRGGFGREAAAQVAGASFATLAALIDKSLLSLTPAGRYEMAALLRRFAGEKLAEDPVIRAETERRHCDYYVGLVASHTPALRGRGQQTALQTIGQAIDDVRAGWAWAAANNAPDAIAQALDGLYHFYRLRSWLQEGEEALGRAATAVAGRPVLQARLLSRQGYFCRARARYDEAGILLRRSHAVFQAHDEPGEQALCALFRGELASALGQYDVAEAVYRQSLAGFDPAGDGWGRAWVTMKLGGLAGARGEYRAAQRQFEEALAAFRAVGDRMGVGWCLTRLFDTAQVLGAYERARDLAQESLAAFRATGNEVGVGWALYRCGRVAIRLGTPEAARRWLQEALALFQEMGHRMGIAWSLQKLGLEAAQREAWVEAASFYRQSLTIFTEIESKEGMSRALCGVGDARSARGKGDGYTYYCRALRIIAPTGRVPTILEVLVRVARLLAEEERVVVGLGPDPAGVLLRLVCAHPATEAPARCLAEAVWNERGGEDPAGAGMLAEEVPGRVEAAVATLLAA